MINTTTLKTSAGETLVTYRTAGSITLIVSATVNGDCARGNVLDVAGRRNSYTPYGINYLR